MLIFPSTTDPGYPLEISNNWKTLKTSVGEGREQRRKRWSAPQRSLTLKYQGLTQTRIDELYNFFMARKGSYDPFYFFSPLKNLGGSFPSYVKEYVGLGDGTTTIFELPSKSTTPGTLIIYNNGIVASATFLSGGGDAGVDRIQFSVAPVAGNIITADFTGQWRLRARFTNDSFSKELFTAALFNSGIEIREVRIN